jgi:hypothetical protein
VSATIGFADRLRFPHFPSQLEKPGNARLRPQAPQPTQELIAMIGKVEPSQQAAGALTAIGADLKPGGATP